MGHFLLVVHWNRFSISCRFKIFASKYIWFTILTFWRHVMSQVMWDNGSQIFWSRPWPFWGWVTSSVMWPFDTLYAISYRCSIVTKSVSPDIFEIMCPEHLGVTTWTFQGHVTSSITWPIDSPYPVSYWCSIVTKPLSAVLLEILSFEDNWITTLTFLGHVTLLVTWPLAIRIPHFLSTRIAQAATLPPALLGILGLKIRDVKS